MIYLNPNTEGSLDYHKVQYNNYINGEWVTPVKIQVSVVKLTK